MTALLIPWAVHFKRVYSRTWTFNLEGMANIREFTMNTSLKNARIFDDVSILRYSMGSCDLEGKCYKFGLLDFKQIVPKNDVSLTRET